MGGAGSPWSQTTARGVGGEEEAVGRCRVGGTGHLALLRCVDAQKPVGLGKPWLRKREGLGGREGPAPLMLALTP